MVGHPRGMQAALVRMQVRRVRARAAIPISSVVVPRVGPPPLRGSRCSFSVFADGARSRVGVDTEVAAWLRARGIAGKPKGYVEIHLDVKDTGATMTYWGNEDTVFHLAVRDDEWSIRFVHAAKSSFIRVRDPRAFVHGDDDWGLMRKRGNLENVGKLITRLEKAHGVHFRRDLPWIRSNLKGAKKQVREWLSTL